MSKYPIFTPRQRRGFIAAGHNPLRVARWGLALISGKYRQDRGRLERRPTETEKGGFCCLGVLCAIDPRTIRSEKTFANFTQVSYQPPGATRPDEAMVNPGLILGYNDLDKTWGGQDYPDFATANDTKRANFRQIGWFLLGTVFPILFHGAVKK